MIIRDRRSRLTVAVLALALGLMPGTASAALDLLGTRAIAMGGALRASPSGESSILVNPAGMTLMRNYLVSGLYQFRVSDEASLVNVSVVDSVTNKIAAGLFYSFSHATPTKVLALPGSKHLDLEETRQTHEAGLALAYPIGSYLHIGLLTRYINITVDQPEDTPEALLEEDTDTATIDIGAIIVPFKGLNIAIVGYNVIPVEGDVFPIQLGLGISYNFSGRFLLEFDSVLDFTRDETVAASYHGGAELFLARMVALRAGYQYDTVREAQYVCGGLGFVSRKMGVDVGLRQMVDGGAETLLAISVRMFVK